MLQGRSTFDIRGECRSRREQCGRPLAIAMILPLLIAFAAPACGQSGVEASAGGVSLVEGNTVNSDSEVSTSETGFSVAPGKTVKENLVDSKELPPEASNGTAQSTSQQPSPQTHDAASPTPDPPNSGVQTSSPLVARKQKRPDRNLDIYYRNRREFSLDVGWLPINIPFVYDFAVGGGYNMTPLKYTLMPITAGLRWDVTNIGWPSILRGNMDFLFAASITPIPRGPETHYYAFLFGIRRNFVYRNWRVVPYFDERGGVGFINAKEPLGVEFAQGQNLTFTYDMGAGARYNINSKYSFSAGMNYRHISNAYLSQPQFTNYGINVYGPMFGFEMRLSKPREGSQ